MSEQPERTGFRFYRSYYDVMLELPEAEQLSFLKAILEKQFFGAEPTLTGMAKFAYISQKHSIDKQVKGWEDKVGLPLKSDPCQGPTEGGTQGPTEGPAQQVQEKKKIKEKIQIQEPGSAEPPPFNFRKSLIELIGDKSVAEQYLEVRRNKRLVNTQLAFAGIVEEIKLTGLKPLEIIRKCVTNSWGGFKAEWIKDTPKQGQQQPQSALKWTKNTALNNLGPEWRRIAGEKGITITDDY